MHAFGRGLTVKSAINCLNSIGGKDHDSLVAIQTLAMWMIKDLKDPSSFQINDKEGLASETRPAPGALERECEK